MDWYAPIARHITIPLAARLEGRGHLWRIAEVRRVEALSRQALLDRQWQGLCALLRHAYENTPFYRARFAQAGITPHAIRRPEDLASLPPLTKEDVRDHLEQMVVRDLPGGVFPDSTGGTTGMPMKFYRDARCLSYRAALTEVFDGWYGKRIGDRMALVWGAHRDYPSLVRLKAALRNALVDRLLILAAQEMTGETMARFAAALRRLRPALTRAYPRAMYFFARFVQSQGLSGVHTGPVVATAEPLYEAERTLIAHVFGQPVYDRYGSREIGFIASECPEHRRLHWRPDSVFVEWVRDGREVAPGEVGELVVTDLQNYGMPLIRYRMADLGERPAADCPCGRALPLLGPIAGRDSDVLHAPNGMLVAGPAFTYVLQGRVELSQVQLIQEDLCRFTVRLVRDGREREHETYLRGALREFLGPEAVLAFEFVEAIPREPSGKVRMTVCRLPAEDLLPH